MGVPLRHGKPDVYSSGFRHGVYGFPEEGTISQLALQAMDISFYSQRASDPIDGIGNGKIVADTVKGYASAELRFPQYSPVNLEISFDGGFFPVDIPDGYTIINGNRPVVICKKQSQQDQQHKQADAEGSDGTLCMLPMAA